MADEADLRRRLKLLRHYLADGKIVISEHLKDGFEESFSAVQFGPDGEIDLSTVDGRVRSMALAIVGMEDRRETKEAVSLKDLQHAYFDFVEYAFGDLRTEMFRSNANPQSLAWAMSRHAETVDAVYPQIEEFVERLVAFWSGAEEPTRYHLQDLHVTKGVFGGDLFPSYTHNIASTCGLYLDTIILTDPFMNSRPLFPKWPKEEAVRFFVKHGLNVLSYKHLALADLDPPIVAIVPFRSSIDEEDSEWLSRIAEPDMLAHAKAVFGRSFDSIEDLASFAGSFTTIEHIVRAVRNPDRLLFDTDWDGALELQIARAIQESRGLLTEEQPGLTVLNQSVGRMMQANDLLIKSREYGGTPVMDAPTSWQYLNWKLEYSAEVSPLDCHPLHITRALLEAEKKAEWLGRIPPDALIDLRREGALAEIRSVLFEGAEEIAASVPTNFDQVTSRIVSNLENAFRKHQEAMDELKRKRLRFYGYDIGSWLVTGTIGMAAAITGNPLLGVGALAAIEVLPAPKLREIPGRIKELHRQEQAARRTPMALLFQHKD